GAGARSGGRRGEGATAWSVEAPEGGDVAPGKEHGERVKRTGGGPRGRRCLGGRGRGRGRADREQHRCHRARQHGGTGVEEAMSSRDELLRKMAELQAELAAF